jgi:3-hydroxyisobutyrate dehydrogenase-like beta-hydroxyacid dehydrogenase
VTEHELKGTKEHTIGWIGAGRMGFAMAKRLLQAGCNVSVYNRTRSKAEPLADYGARIVDSPRELAGCDIVFSMVSTGKDLAQVVSGPEGVLSGSARPKLFVDCSSVSETDSSNVRKALSHAGVPMLAAPVSGNAKVVKAGRLYVVASGPRDAYSVAQPYLAAIGQGVTYVGDGERARMAKIAHNLLLGIVTQALAEITVLAQKGGISRHDFLEFLNLSVMGSIFSKYKTPALVNLDFTPTFTPILLRKDLDLGLTAGKHLGVPLPLTQLTRDCVEKSVEGGYEELDFSVLLLQQAKASGLELQPENVKVSDGLSS